MDQQMKTALESVYNTFNGIWAARNVRAKTEARAKVLLRLLLAALVVGQLAQWVLLMRYALR
jgi:hypothetical protein